MQEEAQTTDIAKNDQGSLLATNAEPPATETGDTSLPTDTVIGMDFGAEPAKASDPSLPTPAAHIAQDEGAGDARDEVGQSPVIINEAEYALKAAAHRRARDESTGNLVMLTLQRNAKDVVFVHHFHAHLISIKSMQQGTDYLVDLKPGDGIEIMCITDDNRTYVEAELDAFAAAQRA